MTPAAWYFAGLATPVVVSLLLVLVLVYLTRPFMGREDDSAHVETLQRAHDANIALLCAAYERELASTRVLAYEHGKRDERQEQQKREMAAMELAGEVR